jgi:hypothetical protein
MPTNTCCQKEPLSLWLYSISSWVIRATWAVLWGGWLRTREVTFSCVVDKCMSPSQANLDLNTGRLHILWTKVTKHCSVDIALPGCSTNSLLLSVTPSHLSPPLLCIIHHLTQPTHLCSCSKMVVLVAAWWNVISTRLLLFVVSTMVSQLSMA